MRSHSTKLLLENAVYSKDDSADYDKIIIAYGHRNKPNIALDCYTVCSDSIVNVVCTMHERDPLVVICEAYK